MNHIRKAVILAAGTGSRLKNIVRDRPKGFLQLGNQPIIEESISKLIRIGIFNILIVTGYRSEYYDALKEKYPFIRTVQNPLFETTGSMDSLLCARGMISEDFLVLESDLIYEYKALQSLQNSPEPNCILLSGKTNSGDEVYVGVNGDRIVNLSKEIRQISRLGGELVGISKISLDLYQAMADQSIKKTKPGKYDYEDCLTDLAEQQKIKYLLEKDLAWMEIDDENHYRKAKEIIFPLIQKRDSETTPFKKVKRNILLNPGPATTTDTVKYSMVVEDVCPRETDFGDLVESIRGDLARVVHGGNAYETVLFAGSGTGAVEACLTSVVPEGKSVLVINNGAYGKRIQQICDRFEIPHTDYNLEWGDPIVLSALRDLIEIEKSALSHIAFVHHETTVGILNPLDDISKLASEYHLEVIVDAMSSYAGIPIDVNRSNLHYLISAANKCIQGMAGISFVICKKNSLEKIKTHKRRSFYFDLYENYEFFITQKQMRFTPPVQILYALRQALNEYFIETEEGRTRRYSKMYEILKSGLEKIGFRFLVPQNHRARLLTAVIEPDSPNYHFKEMHDYLYQKGFTIYPGKGTKANTFRIANIGAIYEEDITEFIKTLEAYTIMKNIKF